MEKVNHVVHVIWSLSQGGAEKVLLDLVNQSKTDYVLVISKKSDFNNGNKNIIYLKGTYFNKIQQILFYSKNAPVVLWMYKSICFCFPILFLRNSCASIHHDLKYLFKEKIGTQISILLTLILHKFSKCHVIYVSEASLKSHIRIGFSRSNATIIPNGSPVISPRRVNPSKKQMLYVSRWDKIKNFNLAIEISKILLSEKIIDQVVFVGKDVDYSNSELSSIIDQYNLKGQIALEGFQTDLSRFYSKSSFTLISSFSESCPMVLLESLSYGLPCFSTDVGDVRKIYNYDDDFIYASVLEAKQKILKYLNKTEHERSIISNDLINNHRYKYSHEAMKKNYLDLYEKLFFS